VPAAPGDFWYYVAGKQPQGPVSAEQLREVVAAGVVRPDTLVCNAAWSEWRPAREVPGLFPLPGPPPAPPSPPLPSPPVPGEYSDLAIDPTSAARWPTRSGRRRRRHALPGGMVLVCLGAVAACGVLLAIVWTRPTLTDSVPAGPVVRSTKKAPAKSPSQKPTPQQPEAFDSQLPEISLDPNARPTFGRSIFELPTPSVPRGRIDELVFAKLHELGIEPAHPCSDAVFLRRAYLDVIGTLPTVEEARAFLTDKDPDKRDRLIDALLQRREFADFWAMKWSDLLRVKAEFPINLWPNAAQAYHRWIHHAIRSNMPYDRFVRELLTSSGSNFRVPQVNFYRAMQSRDPKGIARAVALTFMGTRVDHWPEERLAGMAAFFTKVAYKPTGEWKEEIVIFDPLKGILPQDGADKSGQTPGQAKSGEKKAGPKRLGAKKSAGEKTAPAPLPDPVFPDGTRAEIPWDKDPRVVFADWLIRPDNPWFTRSIVNRIWYWLVGRGIIHEPDDIREDNPPSNPALLDYLAAELVAANYDLKHIYRLILKSSTYQFSPLPRSTDPRAAVHFASYTVRRLEAEVIIDALNQITGTTESYSSIIPEPYTFIPENRRAIALPDGSITSSFLELFGRPPRDTGLESERNSRITAAQRLHLLNSSHVRDKIRNGPALRKLLQEGNATENLYLAILSRFPSEGEGGTAGETLAWTLINTTEFLFRH